MIEQASTGLQPPGSARRLPAVDARATSPIWTAPPAPRSRRLCLDRMRQFYETSYANIHRAVYPLSEAATEAYEGARARVARFLKAPSADSIVFTRNATEAVNLVAYSLRCRGSRAATASWSRRWSTTPTSCPGSCCATGKAWTSCRRRSMATAILISTRWIACWSASRSWSPSPPPPTRSAPRTPIKEIIARAHRAGAVVLVDGAQAAPHFAIDVDGLGLRLPGLHRPQAVRAGRHRRALRQARAAGRDAALAGRRRHDPHRQLRAAPNMPIRRSASRRARRRSAPAIGLAAAIDFIEAIGWDRIEAHDRALTRYALDRLQEIPGIRPVGTPRARIGIVSFTLDGVHPARRRIAARRARRLRAHRPPLRAAPDGSSGPAGHGARLLRRAQRHRRRRPAGRRIGGGAANPRTLSASAPLERRRASRHKHRG